MRSRASLSLYLATGIVSFAVADTTQAADNKPSSAPSGGPYKVIAANFTGAKTIDLAVAYSGIGLVTVERGDGRGGFVRIGEIDVRDLPPSEIRGAYNLAHADVDNDGLPDLVMAVHGTPPDEVRKRELTPALLRDYWRGRVVIARNLGKGRFQKMAEFDCDSQATGVRFADLDGDGRLDVLYTARGSGYKGDLALGKLMLRQGRGDWKYGPALEFEAGRSAYNVQTADLNNDGFLDILVPNEHANTVSYFMNPGKEIFQKPQAVARRRVTVGQLHVGEPSAHVNDVRAGDFNGDGKLDLVTANLGSSTISVFLGDGDGSFRKDTVLDGGKNCAFLAVGDLDGDGALDFVVTHWTEDFLSVFLNKGDGAFFPRKDYRTALGNYGVTLSDLDGDGKVDIVTANYRHRSISVLKGAGAGTFRAAVTIPKALHLKDGHWVDGGKIP